MPVCPLIPAVTRILPILLGHSPESSFGFGGRSPESRSLLLQRATPKPVAAIVHIMAPVRHVTPDRKCVVMSIETPHRTLTKTSLARLAFPWCALVTPPHHWSSSI